jgi:hypothetical protein
MRDMAEPATEDGAHVHFHILDGMHRTKERGEVIVAGLGEDRRSIAICEGRDIEDRLVSGLRRCGRGKDGHASAEKRSAEHRA